MMDMWLFSESKLRTKFDTISVGHLKYLTDFSDIADNYQHGGKIQAIPSPARHDAA